MLDRCPGEIRRHTGGVCPLALLAALSQTMPCPLPV